jgi:hypothetical protein
MPDMHNICYQPELFHRQPAAPVSVRRRRRGDWMQWPLLAAQQQLRPATGRRAAQPGGCMRCWQHAGRRQRRRCCCKHGGSIGIAARAQQSRAVARALMQSRSRCTAAGNSTRASLIVVSGRTTAAAISARRAKRCNRSVLLQLWRRVVVARRVAAPAALPRIPSVEPRTVPAVSLRASRSVPRIRVSAAAPAPTAFGTPAATPPSPLVTAVDSRSRRLCRARTPGTLRVVQLLRVLSEVAVSDASLTGAVVVVVVVAAASSVWLRTCSSRGGRRPAVAVLASRLWAGRRRRRCSSGAPGWQLRGSRQCLRTEHAGEQVD